MEWCYIDVVGIFLMLLTNPRKLSWLWIATLGVVWTDHLFKSESLQLEASSAAFHFHLRELGDHFCISRAHTMVAKSFRT